MQALIRSLPRAISVSTAFEVIEDVLHRIDASDSATKLAYMQQRYYDPEIGRFMSSDPVSANSRNGSGFKSLTYLSLTNCFHRLAEEVDAAVRMGWWQE